MEGSTSFPVGVTAQENGGFDFVPECYKIAPISQPSLHLEMADIPIINLEGLNNSNRRHILIKDIANACRNNGFFQVSAFFK